MVLLESGLQYELEQAPEALIEPVKRLVEIGMKRVREGVIRKRITNELEQSVTLLDKSNRIYKVTDASVETGKDYVLSLGPLNKGLQIYGYQLGKDPRSTVKLRDIEIPRDPDLVDTNRLFMLRGINPVALEILANELQEAEKVHNRNFPNRQ